MTTRRYLKEKEKERSGFSHNHRLIESRKKLFQLQSTIWVIIPLKGYSLNQKSFWFSADQTDREVMSYTLRISILHRGFLPPQYLIGKQITKDRSLVQPVSSVRILDNYEQIPNNRGRPSAVTVWNLPWSIRHGMALTREERDWRSYS